MTFEDKNSEKLLKSIASEMNSVDQIIISHLKSEIPLINQISHYIISAGGKRLRPAILILIAKALNCQNHEHLRLAAAIEFIHTATLLHDDVVDESTTRRGKETANAVFGNAASVLVGDFLYTRSFQMMVSAGNLSILRILADAVNIISEGEVLQLLNISNTAILEKDYLQIIHYKTARLFEAAAEMGAVIANGDKTIQDKMASFGRKIGTAFQLLDDWLDYAGDEAVLGKKVGDDLREGKLTLPLIYLIKEGKADEAAFIKDVLSAKEISQSDFTEVFSMVKRSSALDYTLEKAHFFAEEAQSSLLELPDSNYKQTLINLCAYSTQRLS